MSLYQQSLKRLLNKTSNPKLGLNRISKLLERLDIKLGQTKTVQVVGTNGKGSTVAFLESLLLAHGLKTGLFTSPHLCSARERIRLNGQQISEEDFVAAADAVLAQADHESDQSSFFECVLAMALWLFKRDKIDVIILEAGLGGRLDATTACQADILGLSMVDFDHQNILGDSLAQISAEKIAAARSGQLVISVEQHPQVKAVIDKAEQNLGFILKFSEPTYRPLGLIGEHQRANAGLALALFEALAIRPHQEKISQGLLGVNWPGRYEIINREVKIIFDGAHNPSGLKAFISLVGKENELVLIYGSLSSANLRAKTELLLSLKTKHIFLHAPNNPRAESTASLKALMIELGEPAHKLSDFISWPQAEAYAKKHHKTVAVLGSLYTVGELRGDLLGIECDVLKPAY